MLNKIFKPFLIVAFTLFAISLNSCKKPEDTKAIITIIDINGDAVKDVKVRLHQDPQPGAIVSDEAWTDHNGQTEHVFELEAILIVSANKWVGGNELTGEGVVNLKKNKTVRETIEID